MKASSQHCHQQPQRERYQNIAVNSHNTDIVKKSPSTVTTQTLSKHHPQQSQRKHHQNIALHSHNTDIVRKTRLQHTRRLCTSSPLDCNDACTRPVCLCMLSPLDCNDVCTRPVCLSRSGAYRRHDPLTTQISQSGQPWRVSCMTSSLAKSKWRYVEGVGGLYGGKRREMRV